VKAFTVVGALCATVLVSTSGFSQEKPIRIRGTIEQIDGALMTIKSREGDTLKVKLAEDGKVIALVKASLDDIKPNSFVGSTAMPEPDGSWKAVEVHIFPEEMRGTGEGDRPYDYKPKSTMTNGTVNSVSKSKVNGTVTTDGGTTLTLNYKDGAKKIDVTAETVIVTYVPGSKEELKAGARIYVPAATRQADGTLMTPRVNVGRGVAPPM
jgi:archaellin